MLKFLIQKEFLQIRRNSFLPKLIIMFPIVIMCVMPWVMQMEVKNVVVDVVDIDHTMESQRLVQQVAASNYFIFGGPPMPSMAPREAWAHLILVR